ncbi:sulfonate ABC transporter permease [Rhodoplanes roseus]|uniref:Sulfonate ABC transporter permease n=1 Tax=Rhodoplanes roseus TaxID=29409 RepID=A0A327KY11_9BRAD|nr:sulfonate ABC transporter permease [Rhodoplanes roseus]
MPPSTAAITSATAGAIQGAPRRDARTCAAAAGVSLAATGGTSAAGGTKDSRDIVLSIDGTVGGNERRFYRRRRGGTRRPAARRACTPAGRVGVACTRRHDVSRRHRFVTSGRYRHPEPCQTPGRRCLHPIAAPSREIPEKEWQRIVTRRASTLIAVQPRRPPFGVWDAVAIVLILGALVILAEAARGVALPLGALDETPISLDPGNLPGYAARTALRMITALALSLLFTFTYATLAARSRRAEQVLVPLLDILQSVPILGFISVTIVFFMSLAPGRVLGAEFAAVFAIFTSQAWNMAFSFYQSLRTVPDDLVEASRCFRFGAWMRFWRLDVPFAMPALVWNMMMSMSGGWFFVVASEAITVGDTTVTLPGIGSYIALAIAQRDLVAIGWAIGAMLVVIAIFDQLMFRPLVAWADKFRFDQGTGAPPPTSWVLSMVRGSRLVRMAAAPVAAAMRWSYRLSPKGGGAVAGRERTTAQSSLGDRVFTAVVLVAVAVAIWQIVRYVLAGVPLSEIATALLLGLATMTRVFVLIAIASLIWVPIGIKIGLAPRLARIVQPIAQFLAAFPANLLFPIAVSGIVAFRLDPNIWLSPLMILGTQWYILFNVIAGATTIPGELRDVATNLRVRGWLWWRKVALPAVFPFYVTGAITASGGSWNASIVAEVATWGNDRLEAAGLGSYIARATEAGDYHRVVLGIAVMSAFVVIINRVFWRPLYLWAERKFRLG